MKHLNIPIIALLCLGSVGALASTPEPIVRNPFSTNAPGTPVIGQNNISITNQGGSNWQFYGTGARAVAVWNDVTNIATAVGGGVTAAQLQGATNAANYITANGNPTMAAFTASTNAGNYITASGNPTTAALTSATNSGNYITATKVATTGTPDGTKFLRDDYSWQAATGLNQTNNSLYLLSGATNTPSAGDMPVYSGYSNSVSWVSSTNFDTIYATNLVSHTFQTVSTGAHDGLIVVDGLARIGTAIITNGIALGGVTNTSWPSSGGSNFLETGYVVYATNAAAAKPVWLYVTGPLTTTSNILAYGQSNYFVSSIAVGLGSVFHGNGTGLTNGSYSPFLAQSNDTVYGLKLGDGNITNTSPDVTVESRATRMTRLYGYGKLNILNMDQTDDSGNFIWFSDDGTPYWQIRAETGTDPIVIKNEATNTMLSLSKAGILWSPTNYSGVIVASNSVAVTGAANSGLVDVDGVIKASGTVYASNGVALGGKQAFYTNYTMTGHDQLLDLSGTNQTVKLLDCTNSQPYIIYQFTSTNQYGSFQLITSNLTQTVRDGVATNIWNYGVGNIALYHDGKHWLLAGKAKTILPTASWSTSTNVPFSDVTNATVVEFDTVEIPAALSSGIGLSGGSKIYLTNSGAYLITYSAVVTTSSAGVNWLDVWMQQDGTNYVRSRTRQKITAANQMEVMTVNYLVPVTGTTYFELYGATDDDNMQMEAGAAITAYYSAPSMPAIILTVNKVSD